MTTENETDTIFNTIVMYRKTNKVRSKNLIVAGSDTVSTSDLQIVKNTVNIIMKKWL